MLGKQVLHRLLIMLAIVGSWLVAHSDLVEANSGKGSRPTKLEITEKKFVVATGEQVSVTVRLTAGKGSNRAPLPDQEVTFATVHEGKGRERVLDRAVTNDDGSATLTVTNPGGRQKQKFVVRFSGSKKYLASKKTGVLITANTAPDPPGGDESPLPAPHNHPFGAIEGHVVVAGLPGKYATVRVMNSVFSASDHADKYGYFRIDRSNIGRQTLEVRLEGSMEWEPVGPVDVEQDQTVRVELRYTEAPPDWVIVED